MNSGDPWARGAISRRLLANSLAHSPSSSPPSGLLFLQASRSALKTCLARQLWCEVADAVCLLNVAKCLPLPPIDPHSTNTVVECPNLQGPAASLVRWTAGGLFSTSTPISHGTNSRLTSTLSATVHISNSRKPNRLNPPLHCSGWPPLPLLSSFIGFLLAHTMSNPEQNPKQVSSTPPTASDKKGGKEGLGSSRVFAGNFVFADDQEDGISYVQRLMALWGPAGRGKGLPRSPASFPKY